MKRLKWETDKLVAECEGHLFCISRMRHSDCWALVYQYGLTTRASFHNSILEAKRKAEDIAAVIEAKAN